MTAVLPPATTTAAASPPGTTGTTTTAEAPPGTTFSLRGGVRDTETVDRNNMRPKRVHTDIAGCLIAKEDNKLLPEWIAYHYHVLPMRDLIICEQPDSREFAEDTLQGTRWSPFSEDPLLNVNYVLAGDTFFNDDSEKLYLSSSKYKEAGGHRKVQGACYAHCMKEFKKIGKVRTSNVQENDDVVGISTHFFFMHARCRRIGLYFWTWTSTLW